MNYEHINIVVFDATRQVPVSGSVSDLSDPRSDHSNVKIEGSNS